MIDAALHALGLCPDHAHFFALLAAGTASAGAALTRVRAKVRAWRSR